jgi:hypothetical protein
MRSVLVVFLLSGCASAGIPITDHVVYGDEGVFGAVKVHTLATTTLPAQVAKKDWDSQRIGMVCMQVSDLNAIQKAIDTLCTNYTGACDYAAQKTIATTVTTLSAHLKKVQAKP